MALLRVCSPSRRAVTADVKHWPAERVWAEPSLSTRRASQPSFFDLPSANVDVVEHHRELDVIPVRVVDVNRHPMQSVGGQMQWHVVIPEVFHPPIVIIQLD